MTLKSPENKSKAFFPGSFNPFTAGHASVVERALQMFDSVIVAVGYNAAKGAPADIRERVAAIERIYEGNCRVEVMSFAGLTAEVAREAGAACIVKGVRNCADFEYELVQADVNRRLNGIETLFLPSLPEYRMVSSSLVRELQSFGADTSPYLPTNNN